MDRSERRHIDRIQFIRAVERLFDYCISHLVYDFPDDVLAMTEVMGTGIMLMMGISIMQKPMPRIEKSYWTKPLGLGHDNWAIARLIRSTRYSGFAMALNCNYQMKEQIV